MTCDTPRSSFKVTVFSDICVVVALHVIIFYWYCLLYFVAGCLLCEQDNGHLH